MGLKDLKLPTAEVEVPGGGSFAVRGLSFTDIRALFIKHSAEVNSVFTLIARGKEGSATPEEASETVAHIINTAPALVAEVIAVASGEEDAFEEALALPFPVQVDALKKIGQVTFGSEDGLKKFVQTVSLLMRNQAAPSA